MGRQIIIRTLSSSIETTNTAAINAVAYSMNVIRDSPLNQSAMMLS